MFGYRINTRARIATLAATLTLVAGSGTAFGAPITWKGVTFETFGAGTATVDGNDHLLLSPDSNSGFGLHVNRIPDGGSSPSPINASGTPFISFSFLDTGVTNQNIDVAIQDESATGAPRVAAGSLFSATQAAFATYGDNSAERSANTEYSFFTQPRDATSHDVTLGKTADSTLYTTFDGEQRSQNLFKDAGISFDFNDLYFRARNADGETIRFTNFAYGDNFSPLAADVPEPGSLGMLGLGALLLAFMGRRRRC